MHFVVSVFVHFACQTVRAWAGMWVSLSTLFSRKKMKLPGRVFELQLLEARSRRALWLPWCCQRLRALQMPAPAVCFFMGQTRPQNAFLLATAIATVPCEF